VRLEEIVGWVGNNLSRLWCMEACGHYGQPPDFEPLSTATFHPAVRP